MAVRGAAHLATVLLVAASSAVLGLVIKNGAPCLEGLEAVTTEEILKDDWACFTFCSPLERTDMCRACCLDPEAAGGGAASGTQPPTPQPSPSPATAKDGDDSKTEKPEKDKKADEKTEDKADDKKEKPDKKKDDAEGAEKPEGGDASSTAEPPET